jgi:MFS family permease
VSGAWAPLSQRTFRALWLANLVSDIGTAMHAVGAGWLMTELAPSPFIVALVQAATTAPMFLLLLPAGALGDILDRRRLLIFALCWSVLTALALGLVTLAGWTTPALLLAFTLILGIGAALAVPSFQAVVPELVPRELLPAAVSLSSMGVNIARAAGPAIAGLLIASLGVASVFIFNAASTALTIVVLWRWQRTPRAAGLPPEPFWSALRIGARYARNNPQLGAVLIRSAAFYSFAAALWALLPLVGAKLAQGASGYAILLSCLGAGAVLAALTLPRIRPMMSSNALSALSTLVFAAATAAAGLLENFYVVAGVMVPAGWAWLANLTTFNITARFSIADWVMSRGLAINQMVFFGGMTLGSIVWGQVAALTSIEIALACAGIGMAAALAGASRLPLAMPAKDDLKPSLHWAEPSMMLPDAGARARVLTTIEYRIDPAQAAAFLAALGELKAARLRNGGYGWNVYEDVESPGRYVEHFLTDSWVEHLRQHQRTTMADKATQDNVRGFHRGEQPPKVSHLASPSDHPSYG